MRRFKTILSFAHAVALVAALSLAVPATAQTEQNEKLTKIKVDNFGCINANYYRGAQPKGQDYADLAALGIKTVINLTSDDAQANEKAMVEGAGMKYYQIPMTTHKAPTPAKLAEFLGIVNDPASKPVYVHCAAGKHRTGVMTAVYRMTQDDWSADQALKEMKQYKFGMDFFHREFKNFVYSYYSGLAHTLKSPDKTVEAAAKASN